MSEYSFSELSAEQKRHLAQQAMNEWRREVKKCRSEEELVEFADRLLRPPLTPTSFARWLRVGWHVVHCALCRAEVACVRRGLQAATPPARRIWRRAPAVAYGLLVVVVLGGVGLTRWHAAQLRLVQQEAHRQLTEQEALAKAQQEATAQALHEAHLQLAAQEAIIDSLSDLAQIQAQMASAPAADVGAAVRQIHAVPLRAVAQGQTYSVPYLFVGEGPKNPEAIAEGLLQSKDLQAEYEVFLRQWATLLADLGDRLAQEGKVEDALMVFIYLGQRNPEAKDVLFALGELLKMTGQHKQAIITVYNDMIDRGLAADDPRPWHFAGWSYYQLGDCQSALRYYDQALAIAHRIAPQRPYAKVYYNKALCYRDMPGLQDAERERLYQENLQQALDLTLAAYQREGDDNPRIPFSLSILYAEIGKWDQALEKLERAVQKERTYRARGQADPAFAAVRDDPSAPYHERFAKLLKQYQPPALGGFGARLEATFDPEHFSE